MKGRLGLAGLGLGLALLLSGSAILSPRVTAQDSAGETKRKLKSKTMPDYPALARQLNLVGKVKVETAVAADGHVISTKVLGGNPVLASSAQDAIKKWRFEPAPKDTIEVIEVDFTGKG
ncbi:MAG TPA: energy transducer TonB [Candidatus Acidoferrales bacterium]|nr:energy transducer TonB [Candidatus Acidoferrales bacterium]